MAFTAPILVAVALGVGGFFWLRSRPKPKPPPPLDQPMSTVGGDPLLGREIDRYLLTACLGKGAMATVYRAVIKGTQPEESLAFKVLESRDPDLIKRLRREIDICRHLSHPGIVRLYDFGQLDSGPLYIVLELVEGDELTTFIKPGGLKPEEAVKYLVPAMEAVDYAHSRTVIHRDLKPANIMVDWIGQVKIMDFGLSRWRHARKITIPGAVLGTPEYMAPEQMKGGPPRASSDQYALGCIAYEVLSGRHPFAGYKNVQMLKAHLQEEPTPLRDAAPHLAPEICEVVHKMMAKDPDQRYPSLGQAAIALSAAVASSSGELGEGS